MSRKLFLQAIQRSRDSNINVFGSGTSIVCHELMDEVGVYFPEAHCDAEKMYALALAGHTVLGFDVVMPLFSVCHEAAAMGCNVNWGKIDMMPECGKPIFKQASDIIIPSDLLTRSSCNVPLKAIAALKKEVGEDAAVCGKVFGSWTQAYHYFGLENFLMMSITEPDHTKMILDKLKAVTVAFANAQVDAGADCILLGDHATRDLCSPVTYRDYLMEMHHQLSVEIKVPVILHICGNTSDRIDMISKTGLPCFHYDTKTGEPSKVRSLAGHGLALMGGISNIKLMTDEPNSVFHDAIEAVKGDIDVIGPECAIPLQTRLVNLKAITAIGRMRH
jgi:MtaA/CmuA family methyltransferase